MIEVKDEVLDRRLELPACPPSWPQFLKVVFGSEKVDTLYDNTNDVPTHGKYNIVSNKFTFPDIKGEATSPSGAAKLLGQTAGGQRNRQLSLRVYDRWWLTWSQLKDDFEDWRRSGDVPTYIQWSAERRLSSKLARENMELKKAMSAIRNAFSTLTIDLTEPALEEELELELETETEEAS